MQRKNRFSPEIDVNEFNVKDFDNLLILVTLDWKEQPIDWLIAIDSINILHNRKKKVLQ